MKFSYRRTSKGFELPAYNIHAYTRYELRYRLALCLVRKSKKDFQEIYDEIELVQE